MQPPVHPDEPRLLRRSDYQLRSKSAQQTWDTLKIRAEKRFILLPMRGQRPGFSTRPAASVDNSDRRSRSFWSITVRNSITFVKNSNAPEEEKATRHAEEWIHSAGTEMGTENSRV